MDKLLTVIFLASSLMVTVNAIDCVPCDDVTCVPPPPGCELGRRVCSCCEECRVKEGGSCGAFTAECESHLVCFTGTNVFVGRPPVESTERGRCVKYEDTIPKVKRSALENLILQRK